MDLGLDAEEDWDQLASNLEIIQRIGELCDQLPDDLTDLDRPNSELRSLIEALPEPQVDLRLSISQGLGLARGTLDLVRSIFINNSPPIAPSVLPVLLRSAVMGAGRILYMLGPQSDSERIANARTVMSQEAESYYRAYTQFSKFEQLTSLVPPAETVAQYERRRPGLMQGGRPPGDAKTLDSMADVVGEVLVRESGTSIQGGAIDDLVQAHKEHVRWIFNVYSGVAHGFAWPWLVPRTKSLPGRFIAELTTTVSVVHIAADITLRRSGIH